MPYTAEISRTNPSCFLFLIDQSGSMQEPFGSADGAAAGGKTKAEGLADAINRLLQNLVIKCAKSDGIRDYYHVGVIGYGGKGVGPAFGGALKDKDMVPVSEIANNPMRVEQRVKKTDDGAGGIIEQKIKFPVWFDAMGEGGTPMCTAFITANKLLTKWMSEHPNCFPPIVINISDGESSDMDPYQAACDLLSLASTDGEVAVHALPAGWNTAPSAKADARMRPPQTIMRLPVQTAEWRARPVSGAAGSSCHDAVSGFQRAPSA